MPQLTPHAKAIVSALVAVALAGFTAFQSVDAGHFTPLDAVPVAVAVVAALQTKLIPNLGLAWAKAAINVGAAVVTAVAAVVADPTNVSAAKISIAAVGAFLVWFVPELGPLVPVVEAASTGKHGAAAVTLPSPAPVTVAVLNSAQPVNQPLDATQPFPAVTDDPAPAPAVAETVPSA